MLDLQLKCLILAVNVGDYLRVIGQQQAFLMQFIPQFITETISNVINHVAVIIACNVKFVLDTRVRAAYKHSKQLKIILCVPNILLP